ncbi:hypothetical protein GQ464_008970 [Rhodocaloribacter litoris]|uniref:hypothetical protein n=1 Tax=Rhodocaloribacter litoris TaxID=2558931 RepID=UPI00142208EB|nr:hypothetical protein [Rhodocaloribacter litoris]QXD17043.1 hypothetical protein GQ464_008970 [Rhodocaloribacter litoris]
MRTPGERAEVTIQNCRFREEVRLADLAGGPSLVFRNCIFEKGLCAREAEVGRSLRLEDCTLRALEGREAPIALDLKDARMGQELALFGCRLEGVLFAPGLRAERDVRVRGCVVTPVLKGLPALLHLRQLGEGRERLGEAWRQGAGDGIRTFGAMPAVVLDDARIGGDLELSADLPAHRQQRAADALRLAGPAAGKAVASRLFGSVRGRRLHVGGQAGLFGTRCHGYVDLTRGQLGSLALFSPEAEPYVEGPQCHVSGYLTLQEDTIVRGLDLQQARIEGEVVLDRLSAGGRVDLTALHTSRSLSLYAAGIEGDLALDRAAVGEDVSLYLARVGMNLDLQGLDVQGDLTLTFATVQGYLTAFGRGRGLTVGGTLNLSGADVRAMELRGATIRGKIEVITGTFRRLFLSLGVEAVPDDGDGTPRLRPKPCRTQAVYMTAIEVEETMDVSGLEVALPADRDEHERERLRMEQEGAGFTLTQSHIGQDLRFFPENPRLLLERRFADRDDVPWQVVPVGWDVAAGVWGNLVLQANEIGGALDLRQVRVEGDILLNDTTVGRDLDMGAGDPAFERFETRCRRVDAEKLTCHGDVDLTGLRAQGDLLARGARVQGEVRLLHGPERSAAGEPPAATEPARPGYARIEGRLDLTALEASHVVLSGDNVPDPAKDVSLERGRFGRLEIVEPTPGPLNLSKISVDRWVFGDRQVPSAEDYKEVLIRMDPFDRAVWVDVETTLRNQGEDGEANRIYRQMRWKARQEWKARRAHRRWSWWVPVGLVPVLVVLAWRRPDLAQFLAGAAFLVLGGWAVYDRQGFYGMILGFGTVAWWPMIGALLLFPVSLSLFSQPAYVRASTSLLEVLGAEGRPQGPGGAPGLEASPRDLGVDWTWHDGLAMTLRYQVPIIPAVTHTWWEAGGGRLPVLGLTAERYALWLTLYHWIAWPLFLIWLAARVVRGRQT